MFFRRILILGACIFSFYGCDGGSDSNDTISDPAPPINEEPADPAPPINEEPADPAPPINEEPADPGEGQSVETFAEIENAVAAGDITPGQGLLYKYQSIYTPELLPERFQGLSMPPDGDSLTTETIDLYDQLPADEKAAVQPFLIAPFRDGSWWDLRQSGQQGVQTVRPAEVTDDILVLWDFIDTENGKVRIWYDPTVSGHAEKAQAIKVEVDGTIWPKLSSLFGREPLTDGMHGLGSSLLDVVIVDLGDEVCGFCKVVPWGQDDGAGCGKRATYVEIDSGLDGDLLFGTVTHELFHSWQFSYSAENCSEYFPWLSESTATWAEDFVYPDGQTEHEYANSYLNHTNWPINVVTSLFNYGAYLFPQFLAKTFGDQIVRIIWENALSVDSRVDLDSAIKIASGGEKDLPKTWSEFSKSLWNQQHENWFEQWDSMTYTAKIHPFSLTLQDYYEGSKAFGGGIYPLGVIHYNLKFEDDSISGFTFVNGWSFSVEEYQTYDDFGEPGPITVQATPLSEEERQKRPVWMLYRVEDGEWQTEEMTHKASAYFCRDSAAGRIRDVVLILANGDYEMPNLEEMKPPGSVSPFIFYDNVGCYEWTGRINVEGDDGQDYVFSYNWKSGMEVGLWTPPAGQEEILDSGTAFFPVGGKVNWDQFWSDPEAPECTQSGAEEWLFDEISAEYDSFFVNSFDYTVPGHRFVEFSLSSPEFRTTTVYETCVDSYTSSTGGFWYTNHKSPQVSSDGKSINVTLQEVSDEIVPGWLIEANLTANKEWE